MKSSINRLSTALAVLFALAAIAVPSALARAQWVVIDGGDSVSVGCRSLVNKAKALVDEYGRPGTTNARRKEIISELQDIGQTYGAICEKFFGPIQTTDLVSTATARAPPSTTP